MEKNASVEVCMYVRVQTTIMTAVATLLTILRLPLWANMVHASSLRESVKYACVNACTRKESLSVVKKIRMMYLSVFS